MGLFSSTKTRVEEINERIVQHKIVKLTYLQSLAIETGLASAKEYAGETEDSTQDITNETLKDKNAASKFNDALNIDSAWNLFFGLEYLSDFLGSIGGSLFGKERSVKHDLEVKDSGWVFQKSWKEPQFDIIRYGLGIKDIIATQFTYTPVSEFISVAWRSPKTIRKVTLIADQSIPPVFPAGGDYIEYYVKPEIKDSSWVRINPLDTPTKYNANGKIVPRIITFNADRPVNANLEQAYIQTEEEVRSIRLKVIFKRPNTIEGEDTDADSYTPVLRSYRLLMSPEGGL